MSTNSESNNQQQQQSSQPPTNSQQTCAPLEQDLKAEDSKSRQIAQPEQDDVKFRIKPDATCTFCRKSISKEEEELTQQVVNCPCLRASYCSQRCQARDLRFHQSQCTAQVKSISEWQICTAHNEIKSCRINRNGVSGLQNLTNSCYMNCVIQCLSHCKALTNYFLRGLFVEEINLQNPLGTQGKIATSYARVVRQLWESDLPLIVPSSFKQTISRFKKQFSNLEQQDSQEFLNILLDSLHEDLNRVKEKPLVTMIEYHGENDIQASQESWEDHLKRCQSIIVDLMHGQFKSTVKCPEVDCNHISVTFEPFMNISLPIPEIQLVSKAFVWVPYDVKERCSVHRFTIKGHESIKNLRVFLTHEIFNKLGLCDDHDAFEICHVHKDRVVRMLSDTNLVFELHNSDSHLFIFEQPSKKKYLSEDKNQRNSMESSKVASLKDGKVLQKSPSGPTIRGHDEDSRRNIQVEIFQRIRAKRLPVIVNFQFVNFSHDKKEQQLVETIFPRIKQVDLDCNLIQFHLEIFKHIKYIFTRFLQLKEQCQGKNSEMLKQRKQTLDSAFCKNNDVSHFERKIFNKKLKMQIPYSLTLEKWNNMSLSQQFEMVFSSNTYKQQNPEKQKYQQHQNTFNQCIDPSRRKPHELPYFLRIVSRKQVQEGSKKQASGKDNGASKGAQKGKSAPKKTKKKNEKNESSQHGQNGGQTRRQGTQDDHADMPGDGQVNMVKKCLYCDRKTCEDCPLPFNDKITLRNFLLDCNITISEIPFFRNDDDQFKCKKNMNSSQAQQAKNRNTTRTRVIKNQKAQDNATEVETKKNVSSQKQNNSQPCKSVNKQSKKTGVQTEKQNDHQNDDDSLNDFQVVIQFNREKCWGLFELLNRAQNEKQTFLQQLNVQKIAKMDIMNDERKKPLQSGYQVGDKNMQLYADKITISDCFRLFNRPEKLSWQNEWYCSKCKAHKQAVKKIQVFKTPPILIITLKRFKGHLTNQKQNTPVHYPIQGLDMRDFMLNNQKGSQFGMKGVDQDGNDIDLSSQQEFVDLNDCQLYDLFAVVLHSGALNGGHYTSLARNKDTWYEFNDKFVIQLKKNDERKIINTNAYILFYQKRNIDFDNIKDYDMIKNRLVAMNQQALQEITHNENAAQHSDERIIEKNQDLADPEQLHFLNEAIRPKRETFMPNLVRFPVKKRNHELILKDQEFTNKVPFKIDNLIPHSKWNKLLERYNGPNNDSKIDLKPGSNSRFGVWQSRQRKLLNFGKVGQSQGKLFTKSAFEPFLSENDMCHEDKGRCLDGSNHEALDQKMRKSIQNSMMELDIQDGKSTLESRSHLSGQAVLDEKSAKANSFSDGDGQLLRSLGQVQISDADDRDICKMSQFNQGHDVQISIEIQSEINTKQLNHQYQTKMPQIDEQIEFEKARFSQSESSSQSSSDDSSQDCFSLSSSGQPPRLAVDSPIFKLEKVPTMQIKKQSTQQLNESSQNKRQTKKRGKEIQKQKQFMITINLNQQDPPTKTGQNKKRAAAKAPKLMIPRKRRKVLLDIKPTEEQDHIYSLLHHVDVINDKHCPDDNLSCVQDEKAEQLLSLVERTGSSGVQLDDLQCAKIVLLQNRSNRIKGNDVSLDQLLGIGI